MDQARDVWTRCPVCSADVSITADPGASWHLEQRNGREVAAGECRTCGASIRARTTGELWLVPISLLATIILMLAIIVAIGAGFGLDGAGPVTVLTIVVALVTLGPWSLFAKKRMRPALVAAPRSDVEGNGPSA
jgi:uncharacterized paraquat-inducible protein A